jgi:signal transduction histidine kinase/CheY-like chemotaxis protein
LVIGVLAGLGVLFIFLSQDLTPQPLVSRYAILVFIAAVAAWLLHEWQPRAGRWLLIAILMALAYVGQIWLGLPAFLALMALPVLLAAPLVGVGAALIAAAAASALIWLQNTSTGGQASMTVPLLTVWGVAGLACVIYRPVHTVALWAWEYYQRATELLTEAQERKAELERVLEDQARANLQLARLNSLAQRLRRAAEEARVAKEQFVANVSHELRTPLNMIVGFTETMLQAPEIYGGRIPPAFLADLSVIQRNATHLAHLIDDVLDLSQIDAEQMALVRQETDFTDLVAGALAAVQPLYASKRLDLVAVIEPGLPSVFCDGTRIREVLLNLLSNAGRFTESGGVRVYVCREKEDVVVAVADTGPGIAAGDINKLFVPFQQLDGSIRRRYGGTGLGLAISKRFIELHGGKIWVESESGTGTTFRFRLPMMAAPTLGPDYRRGILPGWEYLEHDGPMRAPKTHPKPRLMVVERGDTLQRLLERYMEGVEVVGQSSVEDALAELNHTPAHALLVNDVSVARTLERLSGSDVLPQGTPAIICSLPGTGSNIDASGASVRLVKPVARQNLLDALERLSVMHGTALIVDDEPDALQLFGRMLGSSGREYRILLARDGQEALDVIRECRPDVIMLDLVMPHMSGFALLEALNADAVLRKIPTVVVSALDPAGQPIVSSALAITRSGGLTAQQLVVTLRCTRPE